MSTPSIIIQSVGRNGHNNPYDVRVVQRLLNIANFGHENVKVDGQFNNSTLRAIEYFQIKHEGVQRPSGKIQIRSSTLRKLQTYAGKYYTIKDKSVVLGVGIEKVIDIIAIRFYCNTGRKIVVNDGIRTPETQAKAMFVKLELGDDLIRLYQDKTLVTAIVNTYMKTKTGGGSKEQIVQAMTAEITDQVRRQKFISKHLYSKAFDVRSRLMQGQVKTTFKAVALPCVQSFLEETKPPHFHLQAH